MRSDKEQLYTERLNRYTIAMRNEVPDRIPIRPFAAEFAGQFAGFSCQEVTHDYEKAFAAVRKCAAAFDWDAAVANMVYVWTGLTEAMGLNYYGVPGIDVPPDTGFQYREPPEHEAFMRAEDYDEFIEEPTSYLFNTWLPRVSKDVAPPGQPSTYRNNLSFLKGGMAMLSYFDAFGPQVQRLRRESGTVSAIAGILKAPLDILGDKLRGYVGLTTDLLERPETVRAACEALMPHLLHVALSGADPDRNVPVGLWMHRGCVPFITNEQFEAIYWPTLKPILEALWAAGHQTLCYAEGDWGPHLGRIAELPECSIVFHVDRTDIVKAHEILGKRFCLSGGVPNYLLAHGTPDDVRACCKRIIDAVAREGGYVMDACAIIQNDARAENVKAMTDFTRGYGVYTGATPPTPTRPRHVGDEGPLAMPEQVHEPTVKPGACVPWEEKEKELSRISGDRALLQKVWEDIDALAYNYIWQVLLSF